MRRTRSYREARPAPTPWARLDRLRYRWRSWLPPGWQALTNTLRMHRVRARMSEAAQKRIGLATSISGRASTIRGTLWTCKRELDAARRMTIGRRASWLAHTLLRTLRDKPRAPATTRALSRCPHIPLGLSPPDNPSQPVSRHRCSARVEAVGIACFVAAAARKKGGTRCVASSRRS